MKHLQILGPGCARCRKLAENTERAVKDLALECEIDKVTDIGAIVSFGILMTPALVVDGEVKSSGRVLSPEEIKKLIA
jgi:small redox-active disulfide protein 2